MPWVKFEDDFDDDRDLRFLSAEAICLNLCATTFCSRHLTDGFLMEEDVRKLKGYSKAALHALLTACAPGNEPWWEAVEGGYRIRSFLKFNPSAAQVLSKKRARSEAGEEGAAARWGGKQDGKPDSKTDGKSHSSSDDKDDGKPHGKSDGKPDAPYPVSRSSGNPVSEGNEGAGPLSHTAAAGMLLSSLHPELQTPRVQNALQKWAKWQQEKNKPAPTPTEVLTKAEEVNRWHEKGWREADIERCIDLAIVSKYATFYEPKPLSDGRPEAPKKESLEEKIRRRQNG